MLDILGGMKVYERGATWEVSRTPFKEVLGVAVGISEGRRRTMGESSVDKGC